MKISKNTNAAQLRIAGSMIVTRVSMPAVQTGHLTVLFADLRGYTGMAERLPAARVVPLLHEFLKVLTGATKTAGGQVFHIAGDGIMAGFGADQNKGEGAAAALSAGHAILSGFAPIAERWRTELSIESGIGVGVHMGEVAFGSLGSERRKTHTLVGDTVNVAARLCSRARAGEVLFSCAVAAALGHTAASPRSSTSPYLQLPRLELRGRREPIDIWCAPAPERLTL